MMRNQTTYQQHMTLQLGNCFCPQNFGKGDNKDIIFVAIQEQLSNNDSKFLE
jgi:hypothetical protein